LITNYNGMANKITEVEIDKIVNQKNLLVRNLQITQGYHEVAQLLGKFLSFTNVNWFGFGTYASKTAGRAIRHETLPRPLKSALIRSAGYDNTQLYFNRELENSSQPTTADNLLANVLSQVSLLLSRGNLLIFGELAWPFVDLVNQFGKTWMPNYTRLAQFLDKHFTPGPLTAGGQAWLRESLTAFYQARFETNRKRKAELVFLGNMLLALHEQSRLQPVIEQTLAVPFDLFTEGLIPETNQEMGWFRRSKLVNQAAGFSREMVLRSVTRMWMTYTLPHRQMKLGQDVIAPTGLLNFPPELLVIENQRCREIIQQFDRGVDTLAGSGAANWAHLEDRMGFIIDFFRSHQKDKRLFTPPFQTEQVAAIKAGRFPKGVL
jgi:hypothetical protein